MRNIPLLLVTILVLFTLGCESLAESVSPALGKLVREKREQETIEQQHRLIQERRIAEEQARLRSEEAEEQERMNLPYDAVDFVRYIPSNHRGWRLAFEDCSFFDINLTGINFDDYQKFDPQRKYETNYADSFTIENYDKGFVEIYRISGKLENRKSQQLSFELFLTDKTVYTKHGNAIWSRLELEELLNYGFEGKFEMQYIRNGTKLNEKAYTTDNYSNIKIPENAAETLTAYKKNRDIYKNNFTVIREWVRNKAWGKPLWSIDTDKTGKFEIIVRLDVKSKKDAATGQIVFNSDIDAINYLHNVLSFEVKEETFPAFEERLYKIYNPMTGEKADLVTYSYRISIAKTVSQYNYPYAISLDLNIQLPFSRYLKYRGRDKLGLTDLVDILSSSYGFRFGHHTTRTTESSGDYYRREGVNIVGENFDISYTSSKYIDGSLFGRYAAFREKIDSGVKIPGKDRINQIFDASSDAAARRSLAALVRNSGQRNIKFYYRSGIQQDTLINLNLLGNDPGFSPDTYKALSESYCWKDFSFKAGDTDIRINAMFKSKDMVNLLSVAEKNKRTFQEGSPSLGYSFYAELTLNEFINFLSLSQFRVIVENSKENITLVYRSRTYCSYDERSGVYSGIESDLKEINTAIEYKLPFRYENNGWCY
ncbi:MAG: hypothetical protein LBQ57_10025 [Spirochaetales bacterium]|jgi:hypothetical protein|nr:hypothetical protein [Spirochaetales bacterium]